MSVSIRIPITLQTSTGGEKNIYTPPGSVYDICKFIDKNYPMLARKILDENLMLKKGIFIFLNDRHDKHFLHKDEVILDGQKLVIIPSIAGG